MDCSERYNRQILLPEIGEEGQQKLRQARVLIVGAGGLGSPIALYLAGAGVGTIGIADADCVSISNLQRQVLYTTADAGKPKALCAQQRLLELNPHITVHAHPCMVTRQNAAQLIAGYDIVADGCDNFDTRYILDETCSQLGKTYVYGAIHAFEGQIAVFGYTDGKSYRSLYPEPPHISQHTQGVIGVTPGIVGCAQANEVIKVITRYDTPLYGRLWCINLRNMQSYLIDLP